MNNTSFSNFSDDFIDIDFFLETVLGPKQLSLNWLLPLTSVYGVIFITGLVGNACTCLVIARNPYMQTATNCYLFNLAVADMLTLLCAMPLELYSLWHQYPWELGRWTCILRTVVAEATAYASILTIVTFSCQQYIAVCYSFRRPNKSKVSRAIRNIAAIWTISFVAAAPYGVFTKVNYLTLKPEGPVIMESAWCGFPFNAPTRAWETLILCSTFLFFVVPMSLISLLYLRICMVLCKATLSTLEQRTDGQRARMQSRRIVIRMLLTVVVAFFVCWAPYHSQRLLFLYVSLYGEWTEPLRKINQDLFSLAGCFYYFNSTINPLLYSVMSHRFRVAFRENFCVGNPVICCWRWWRDYRGYGASSSASSSHRTPRDNLHVPQQPAVLQGSLMTHLRDKIQPVPAGRFVGMSHSEEKRRDAGDICKPHFNSDPNFSLRLPVMCVEFTESGNSNYELARERESGYGQFNNDCFNFGSYDGVQGIQCTMKMSSLGGKKKALLLKTPSEIMSYEESKV